MAGRISGSVMSTCVRDGRAPERRLLQFGGDPAQRRGHHEVGHRVGVQGEEEDHPGPAVEVPRGESQHPVHQAAVGEQAAPRDGADERRDEQRGEQQQSERAATGQVGAVEQERHQRADDDRPDRREQ